MNRLILIIIFAFLIINNGFAQRLSNNNLLLRNINLQVKPALLSTLFPGLGQLENKQKAKGYAYLGIGAVLLGTAIYTGLYSQSLWGTYENYQTEANYNAYKKRAEKWTPTANIFIGITATFWFYNILDAYMNTD